MQNRVIVKSIGMFGFLSVVAIIVSACACETIMNLRCNPDRIPPKASDADPPSEATAPARAVHTKTAPTRAVYSKKNRRRAAAPHTGDYCYRLKTNEMFQLRGAACASDAFRVSSDDYKIWRASKTTFQLEFEQRQRSTSAK